MADLLLGFDPGTSLTKIIYRIVKNQKESNHKQHLLFMEPETIKLPASSINNLITDINRASPEDSAWFKQNKRDNQIHLVGFIAQRFQARLNMEKLKYESAVAKITAAVGAIAQKHQNHLGHKFTLAIAALLPYGEYSNRKQLEEQIKSNLKRFYFQEQKIQANLKSFRCLPEGGGLALALGREEGEQWLRKRNIAILVFGHRNTSLLYFQRGAIQKGETTDLGFYQMLDSIIRNTSGQNRNTLAQTVFAIGNNIEPSSPLIKSLVKSKKPENIKIEIEQLTKSIKSARQEYWILIRNWLRAALPKEINQIVICGGAAKYLKKEIVSFFPDQPLYWGHDKQSEILNQFRSQLEQNRSSKDIDNLAYRLTDIYCLSDLFTTDPNMTTA